MASEFGTAGIAITPGVLADILKGIISTTKVLPVPEKFDPRTAATRL